MRRRECISYEERCIFAQVVAAEPMFLLQRGSANEVEGAPERGIGLEGPRDEVWLGEPFAGSNHYRRRLM